MYKNVARLAALLMWVAVTVSAVSCKARQVSVSQDANRNSSQPSVGQQAKNSSVQASPQRVSFTSPDGVQIVGSLYSSEQGNSPAVLMLHQWMSTHADFDSLAKEFQNNRIAVLAIDGRGFGESTKQGESTVQPARTQEAVQGMLGDVSSGLTFLAGQPGVNRERLGIIGASYGSSLAIIQAARDNNVKAVALISPGLNYFGNLATEPAVREYGDRPLLVVAAEDDAESAAASRQLDSVAQGKRHELKIFPTGGHGAALLKAGFGLDRLLLNFFEMNL